LQPVLPPAVTTAGNLFGPEGPQRQHEAPTSFRINASPSATGSPHWRRWTPGIVVLTEFFSESVAVFVQLSRQPRTGGLVRAGSAMALSGRSRCISGFRANVCRRCLPSAAVAPENVGARPSAPSATSNLEIISLRSNGLPAAGWWTMLRTITGPIPP
jgi:hypothetical protein